MRKIKLLVIALMAVVIGFSSCNRGVTEPDKIGRQAFDILKNFDVKGWQGFEKNFYTIDEIRKLGTNDKLSTDIEVRNKITSTTEEEWKRGISNSYDEIQKMGREKQIFWKNIEYVDFTYEVDYKMESIRYIDGSLFIKYNEKVYHIQTYSMWNGKEYMLLQMEEY